jgi:hypothetical protein
MALVSSVGLPRNLSCTDTPFSGGGVPAILAANLDDRTIAYAIAMQAPFEHLRQAAAQLAGLLVLAAVGSRTATPYHPMLVLASQAYDEATGAIRATATSPRGKHHHEHLMRAASWIGRALSHARASSNATSLDVDPTLSLLRRGWRELQRAAGALPGFEIVAFEHSCCALHAHPSATDAGRSAAGNDVGGKRYG